MNIGLIGHGFRSLARGLERWIRDCAAGLALSGCRVRVLSIVGEGCRLPRDEVLHLPGASPVQVHRSALSCEATAGGPLAEPEIPPGGLGGFAPHWCSLLAGAEVVCTFGASAALAGAEVRDRLGLPFIAVLPTLPGQADARFREVLRCGADLFAGVSRSMCRRARERFDLHMVLVCNGVDTRLFRPVAASAAESALGRYEVLRGIPGPLITSPVELEPGSGLELLIEAFELVVSMRPDATLLITGNGGPGHPLVGNPYADYLAGLVELKELGARVRFGRGLFEARHLPALYSRSHLCVATGAGERSGLELVESLACETPAVATRTEGLAEVFRHGTGGLLVDGRNPVKVAEGILRLLDDDGLRIRLGRSGRDHVCRAFPLQAQTDRYLELFSSIRAVRAAA